MFPPLIDAVHNEWFQSQTTGRCIYLVSNDVVKKMLFWLYAQIKFILICIRGTILFLELGI